jgi:hypothetical protein
LRLAQQTRTQITTARRHDPVRSQLIEQQTTTMSSKEDEVPPATVEDESTATKSNGVVSVVDEPISSPPDATASTASSSSVIPKSKQSESDELTRRLQKLALERQKESKGDRLKVIQNDASQQHLSSVKTFQELDLPKHLLEAIFAMGFDRPSAIQEEALPRILADPPRNLIGQAQSGSGKVRLFDGVYYNVGGRIFNVDRTLFLFGTWYCV